MSQPQAPGKLYVEYGFADTNYMYEEASNSNIDSVYIPSNATHFHFCQFAGGEPFAVSPTYYLTSDYGTLAELKERFPDMAESIEKWDSDGSLRRKLLKVDDNTAFMVLRPPDAPDSAMVWPIVYGAILLDRETRDVIYSSISPPENTAPPPKYVP